MKPWVGAIVPPTNWVLEPSRIQETKSNLSKFSSLHQSLRGPLYEEVKNGESHGNAHFSHYARLCQDIKTSAINTRREILRINASSPISPDHDELELGESVM